MKKQPFTSSGGDNNGKRPNLRTLLLVSAGIVLLAVIIYFSFFTTAVITVEVQPKNAQVLVNNAPQAVNNSGIAKVRIMAGKYTLRVEANGYVGYQSSLQLKGGNRITKKVSLKSLPKLTQMADPAVLAQKFSTDQIAYLGNGRKTLFTAQAILNSENKIMIPEPKAMTPDVFANVDKIIFSPDGQLAFIKIGTDVYLYDFNKYAIVGQNMTKFGSDIGDIIWSPDQTRVAYYYAPKNGERSLIFSDLLNQNPQRVANFSTIDSPQLEWSKSGDKILVVPRSDDDSKNKVYIFDAYLKQLGTLTDFGNVLSAKFMGDNTSILYFTANNDPKNPIKSVVSVMDLDGQNKKALNINAYPDKTYFVSQKQIIFTTYLNGQEQYLLVDFEKSKMVRIFFEKPKQFEINNMMFSADGKILYVAANNKLYATNVETDEY